MLAASTEAQVAAVAAEFPTVCADYVRALLDLALIRPLDFRVRIATQEDFFRAIHYILDQRGLQNAQVAVGTWIGTVLELEYG